MSLDQAIEELIRLWMRDVSRQQVYREGLVAARLRALWNISYELDCAPEGRWFDALPHSGGAIAFYRENLATLQTGAGPNVPALLPMVRKCVKEFEAQWLPWYSSEQRNIADAVYPIGFNELEFLRRVLRLQEGPGQGFFRQGWNDSSEIFFAFVEDCDLVTPGHAVYGIDGQILDCSIGDVHHYHLRFSAIRATDFFPISSSIRPVDPDTITAEGRRERREALVQNLEGVSLPVIDVFISVDSVAMPAPPPVFGNWWVLGVILESTIDRDYEVHFNNPDDDVPTRRYPLMMMAPAPDFWNSRLRDVFSLVHIPDADFGTNQRDEGAPAALPPMTPAGRDTGEMYGASTA